MRFLLDTHVAVWLVGEDTRLGPTLPSVLEANPGRLFVSVASLWELTIKQTTGKIRLPIGFRDALVDSGVQWLAIQPHHVDGVDGLPDHHKDPFDRMLIAQARIEGMTLVTADRAIHQYDVPVLRP